MSRRGILVILSLGLGDLFFAIPTLAALKRNYPDEPLTFFTHAQNAALLPMFPGIDDVLTYQEKNPMALQKLIKQIEGRHFKMAVVLNPIFRGSLLAWAAGIPIRIGYRHDYERRQSLYGLHSVLLTHRYLPRAERLHEKDRYLDILKMHGLDVSNVPDPKISPSDASIQYAHTVFQKLPDGKRPSVLLNPGGNWDLKRWPADRFAKTADALAQQCNVLFVGSPADVSYIASIRSQMKEESADLSGKTSLAQLPGLLAHADLLISNDTGALHMAAALNKPALALFGPTDSLKYRPLSDKITVLQHGISCSPCKFQYRRTCGKNLCMDSISEDEVLRASEKILGVSFPPQSQSKVIKKKGKKKILYLQSTSEIGGTDISLLRTLETLDKERFKPHVLLPKDGPFVEAYKKSGAKVHFLPSMRKLTSRKGIFYILAYLFGYLPAVFKISGLIRREKIDLVHTNTLHNLYGFLAAKLAGVPHVWHVREIVVQSRLIRAVEVFLARHFSSRIVVMDNAIAAAFFSKTSGYPKHLRKVYEGINLEKFNPARSGSAVRIELGISENRPLVGMVSRLDPWKGPDVFLRAAAIVAQKYPAARFLICGGEIEGHAGYGEKLKELVQTLGLTGSVHFSGWHYQTERMPEVFRALNVSVQCPVNPEPYGLVNIEAMACGIPVVATKEAGPLEICQEGESAFLVPPNNPEAAAYAIMELLAHPERAKEMGNKGRERAETYFDMTRCIRDLESVYEELFRHA